jgi:hypothetical protein
LRLALLLWLTLLLLLLGLLHQPLLPAPLPVSLLLLQQLLGLFPPILRVPLDCLFYCCCLMNGFKQRGLPCTQMLPHIPLPLMLLQLLLQVRALLDSLHERRCADRL